MDALIEAIETMFPDLRWLVRKVEGASQERLGGSYYAHICNDDHTESYEGAAETAIDALQQAFNVAEMARAH